MCVQFIRRKKTNSTIKSKLSIRYPIHLSLCVLTLFFLIYTHRIPTIKTFKLAIFF